MDTYAITRKIFNEDGSFREHAVRMFVDLERLNEQAQDFVKDGYELEYIDGDVCVVDETDEIVIGDVMEITMSDRFSLES
jgi:hypothetical protein